MNWTKETEDRARRIVGTICLLTLFVVGIGFLIHAIGFSIMQTILLLAVTVTAIAITAWCMGAISIRKTK
jgi:hypothetical protein